MERRDDCSGAWADRADHWGLTEMRVQTEPPTGGSVCTRTRTASNPSTRWTRTSTTFLPRSRGFLFANRPISGPWCIRKRVRRCCGRWWWRWRDHDLAGSRGLFGLFPLGFADATDHPHGRPYAVGHPPGWGPSRCELARGLHPWAGCVAWDHPRNRVARSRATGRRRAGPSRIRESRSLGGRRPQGVRRSSSPRSRRRLRGRCRPRIREGIRPASGVSRIRDC